MRKGWPGFQKAVIIVTEHKVKRQFVALYYVIPDITVLVKKPQALVDSEMKQWVRFPWGASHDAEDACVPLDSKENSQRLDLGESTELVLHLI